MDTKARPYLDRMMLVTISSEAAAKDRSRKYMRPSESKEKPNSEGGSRSRPLDPPVSAPPCRNTYSSTSWAARVAMAR